MPNAAVPAWADAHRRPLSDSEQYAAVKLRLFRAFDEVSDMQAEGRELRDRWTSSRSRWPRSGVV